MAEFWFGNLIKAGYHPAPSSGMDADSVGFSDRLDFQNGGAYVAQTLGTHREFNLSWGVQEKSAMNFLTEYRNGNYGDGLLYMVDPFAQNAMPPHWATPGLTCKGWPSLVGPAVQPTLAPAGTVTNLALNPSFETQGGNIALRTNLVKNPVPGSATGWQAPWTLTLGTFSNGNPCLQTTAVAGVTSYVFSDSAMGTFAVGETFQLSMDVEFPDGYPATTWKAHSRTGNTYHTPGQVVLPAQVAGNEVIRVSLSFTVPAGTTIAANDLDMSMVTTGSPAAGARCRVGRLLIEKSTNQDEYFSGETVTTNLATNPVGANLLGWSPNNGATHARSFQVPVMDHPLGITTAVSSATQPSANTSVVASFYNLDGLGTGATGRRVAGAWFKAMSDGLAIQAGSGWPAEPLPRGQWKWVSMTSPATANYLGLGVIKTTGLATPSDEILVTGLTVHEYTTPFHYESPDTIDGEYIWVGTPHASQSIYRAPSVTYALGGAAMAYSSRVWTNSGSRSLRVSSRYASPGSAFADVVNMYSGSLVPGKRYTVRVVAHREQPGNAVATLTYMPYGTGNVNLGATTATMAANEMDKVLRITFVVPAAKTIEYLRLYNSQAQGSPDIWFDDLQIVEGDYTGPYFDGSTEFFYGAKGTWNGTADASTSSMALTPGNMPNNGAQYTILSEPDSVPQRKLTLLVPEDQDLWFGFSGYTTGGGVLRMRGITLDGSYGPVTDVRLLDPTGDLRINTLVSGGHYRAVQIYLTSRASGGATVTLVSSKAVYVGRGQTPELSGGHIPGDGHTGLRIEDVTTAYIQAANGHQYVTTATKATEIEAWI